MVAPSRCTRRNEASVFVRDAYRDRYVVCTQPSMEDTSCSLQKPPGSKREPSWHYRYRDKTILTEGSTETNEKAARLENRCQIGTNTFPVLGTRHHLPRARSYSLVTTRYLATKLLRTRASYNPVPPDSQQGNLHG